MAYKVNLSMKEGKLERNLYRTAKTKKQAELLERSAKETVNDYKEQFPKFKKIKTKVTVKKIK